MENLFKIHKWKLKKQIQFAVAIIGTYLKLEQDPIIHKPVIGEQPRRRALKVKVDLNIRNIWRDLKLMT